jgi:sialidase-1
MKRHLCVLLLALLGLSASTFAATIGETVLNLEPTKENPRSSEGAFVTLKSGRILFYYTQFYGGAHDNSPAHIVAIHSDDAGKTWSKEPQTIVANKGGENVMSVSLLRLKSGRIALFYLLKNNWLDCRPYICFSEDETKTWSAPILMTQAPGYFVLNNDRVIQLTTGRLVAPLAFHRAKASDPKTSRSFDSRAITMWLLSDDEGKTWREADSWWAMPQNTRSGLQEPGVVELADGSLFSWARTDGGSQFVFRSQDQGKTWTHPRASSDCRTRTNCWRFIMITPASSRSRKANALRSSPRSPLMAAQPGRRPKHSKKIKMAGIATRLCITRRMRYCWPIAPATARLAA